MTKLMMIICLLCSSSYLASARMPSDNQLERISIYVNKPTKQGRWTKVTKNILGTAVIGMLIGSLYGFSCAYLEHHAEPFFFWPLSWIIFMCMKHATLEGILCDAKKYNVECNRSTLYNTAWISDWLVYIYMNKGIWPRTNIGT